MLTEPVNLVSGIVLSLGTFFTVFKYLYCSAYLLWALGSARSNSKKVFFFGLLALGLIAAEAIRIPLERPYGLTHDSPFLFSVADTMVTVETGSPMDGWLVGETNRHPAWSLILALSSGLEPSRFLHLLPWLGTISMVLFCASTLAALRWLDPSQDEHRWSGAYFAAFFAVFLSSNPIDFQYSQPIYALNIFHCEPHQSLALPLMLWSGAILLAKTRAGLFVGALAVGMLAYLETTYVLTVAAAIAIGLAVSRESLRCRAGKLAYLAGGLCLGLPGFLRFPSSAVPTADSWSRFTSTWLWPSPVFPLALFAIVWALRGRLPAPRFMPLLLVGVLATAGFTALGTPLVEPGSSHLALRYLLSLFAGYGLYYLLHVLRERISKAKSQWITSTALILLVSWTFPYWWQPRTMDPFYRDSLRPVSPRMETLATWVRENTESDAVFLVWKNLGPWIPAMTGRRVMVGEQSDNVVAGSDLRALIYRMTRGDPALIRPALRRMGITHIVLLRTDLERLPNLESLRSFDKTFQPVFSVANWARVYTVNF